MTAATIVEPRSVVTEAGVYRDLDETSYHSDPVPEGSLSTSGAKRLLPPNCPAIFKYEQDHGRPDKRQFDFGHAAHKLVLGVGAELVVVPGERWDTKIAKAQVAEARARGAVPLKEAEMAQVQAMAEKLREHPDAKVLLHPDSGQPEVSLFWRDQPTNVMRRARFDWLRHPTNGRLLLVDYKSSVTADPAAFGRTAPEYGYDMQDATYTEAAVALGLHDDPAFLFVVQMKTPPYLVSVIELDPLAKRIGRHRNRKAVGLYLECRTTDTWPGYSTDVAQASLPQWAIREYEQETS